MVGYHVRYLTLVPPKVSLPVNNNALLKAQQNHTVMVNHHLKIEFSCQDSTENI
jgi:hypothetical protein